MGMKSRPWEHKNRGFQLQTSLTGLIVCGIVLLLWANLRFLGNHAETIDGEAFDIGSSRRQALELNGGTGFGRRRDSTLVIYVYNAADEEEERNFAFFLRYGIVEDGPTYRIIVTRGHGVKEFPRLPSLPQNAQYLRTEACPTTWGAIDAVMRVLPVADHKYFVVVDSRMRGPFIPSYASPGGVLHWTEAFTNKLTDKVKMVGPIISCEGAPEDGNAAGDWRGNPYVSPHVWATDAEGWQLLANEPGVFRCHGSKWESRYHSDAGASLAMLKNGWTIDCLLTRYQGIDWTSTSSWQCNQRVRPDFEHHYDGISITPYETVFVPVTESTAASRWTFVETAGRYERWMDSRLRSEESKPGVHTNAWISNHWQAKAEKMVYMNTRGPACFDFKYYLENNPDLEVLASDDLALWEHFMVLGQFQSRQHRFSCMMQIGNSYRIAYLLARGPRCFDYQYYAEQNSDLERNGIVSPMDLFEHFAEFGQFEKRKIRFTCADTMVGLPTGFDKLAPGAGSGASTAGGRIASERWARGETAATAAARLAAEQRAALLAQEGDGENPVQQALKGALVAEAAKDAFHAAKMRHR